MKDFISEIGELSDLALYKRIHEFFNKIKD